MDYGDLVAALYAQNQFAIKYDLESMRAALGALGIERIARRVVLVGGTNGKGSTCAELNALAMEAGLRVGLYTSPHLVDFRERIRLQSRPIAPERAARIGAPLLRRFSGQEVPAETPRPLSYFELATLLAFAAFAEEDLDLAIVEVGLGGRLDATNVLDPDVSVIASVSLDHQAYLGDTVEAIAAEKAAIARAGRPVVLHARSGGYDAIVREVARYAPALVLCDGGSSPSDWNRALARAAFRHAVQGLSVPAFGGLGTAVAAPEFEALATRASAACRWPGRQQVIRRGERTLLVDGAHNGASAIECRRWVERELARLAGADPQAAAPASSAAPPRVPVIIGVSGGRDPVPLARALAPIAQRFVATCASSAPTAAPDEVAQSLRAAGLDCVPAPDPSSALELTRHAPVCLVTGSLYLVGDTLRTIGFDAEDLDVWTPADVVPLSPRSDRAARGT